MNFTVKTLATAVITLGMTACSQNSGTTTGARPASRIANSTNIAVMACDASFENVMEQEIAVFEFVNPQSTVLSMYLDEAACIDSIVKGRAQLAVTTRELSQSETAFMKQAGRAPHTTRIAVDAVALIVNKDNPLNELTMSELVDILDGKFKTWNEIRPSKLGDINVVFDHQGSSTVRYMRDSLLDGRMIDAKVFSQGDNKAVFEAVKKNKDALGVIGVSWIASDMNGAVLTPEERTQALDSEDITDMGFSNDIKVLRLRRDDSVDSYQPYQAYILEGKYPLYRSVYMINTGYSGTAAKSFYVFVTGWRGQKLILGTGALPSTMRPRIVTLN